jgi:hypothetical protein
MQRLPAILSMALIIAPGSQAAAETEFTTEQLQMACKSELLALQMETAQPDSRVALMGNIRPAQPTKPPDFGIGGSGPPPPPPKPRRYFECEPVPLVEQLLELCHARPIDSRGMFAVSGITCAASEAGPTLMLTLAY